MSRLHQRGAIAWMARDRITPNLLMLFLIVGGLFFSWSIKKEIMPEFTLDQIEIQVPYPGANPEEIDLSIVLPVENAIRGIEGIDAINSTATSGQAKTLVEVIDGYDANSLLQDIDQAVSRLSTLPSEAEKPRVSLMSRKRDVMEIALYGDVDERVIRTLAENVRDRLLLDPGLTQVDFEDEPPTHQLQVSISQQQLRRYDLTLDEVAAAIQQGAFDQSSGQVTTAGGDINIRVQERREALESFYSIPVKNITGAAPVRLGDIAEITRDFDDAEREMRYNGQLASLLTVYRVGDQTPIGVADTVNQLLPGIIADLPPGVTLEVVDDDSQNFRTQMNLLLKNAFIGLVLVLILLSIFLEYRLAFWVTMGIPTSFLGAMLLLPGMGVSINIVSMFAFIVALGIVVDDAIIAGENIYHRRLEGMGFMKAAILGAKDVAVPLTFSILTNIIAFLPILAIPGFLGKLQQSTPLVVISVFAISWIEALFILPAHLGQSSDRPKGRMGQAIDRFQAKVDCRLSSFVEHTYRPVLGKLLDHRYTTLSVAIGITLLILAWQASGRLGFYLMPRTDANFVQVTATLPYGSAEEKIRETLARLEAGAAQVAEENGGDKLLKGMSSQIAEDVVEVSMDLTPTGVRPITTAEVAVLWREANGEIPDLVSINYRTTGRGPGGDAALTVQLEHNNTETLREASEALAARLGTFGGVSDVSSSFTSGNSQLDIRINERGSAMGLTAEAISRQLRSALFGVTALTQQEGRNELDVRVMLVESERQSEVDVFNFMIKTGDGGFVPLKQVATVTDSISPSSVTRRDGNRTVAITAEVTPRGATPQVIDSLQPSFAELEERYPGLVIKFGGEQEQAAKSMNSLLQASLLAMLMIYALLAIPFQSFVQPLLIMAAIPFGMVGAFLGHIVLGYTLSMISFLGVIALCGVVVNDSLILITTYNSNRKEGMEWKEAITRSAMRRFRPIILTTLTTFGGLAPMIFETSREAQMMIPMAISLGFGILFATVITLIIIPAFIGFGQDVLTVFANVRDGNSQRPKRSH